MAKTKKELMTFGFALLLLLGSSLVLYHVFTNNLKLPGNGSEAGLRIVL